MYNIIRKVDLGDFMKKINANFYTLEKHKMTKDGFVHIRNNDKLFSQGIYNTSLVKEDLPESFIEGYFYYNKGFLNSAGVKELYYKPNKFTNHMFKDDFLYISFKDHIYEEPSMYGTIVKGYDYCVYGGNIVPYLKAVEKYSSYDISKIKEQIEDKRLWFLKTYPEDYKHEVGSWSFFE